MLFQLSAWCLVKEEAPRRRSAPASLSGWALGPLSLHGSNMIWECSPSNVSHRLKKCSMDHHTTEPRTDSPSTPRAESLFSSSYQGPLSQALISCRRDDIFLRRLTMDISFPVVKTPLPSIRVCSGPRDPSNTIAKPFHIATQLRILIYGSLNLLYLIWDKAEYQLISQPISLFSINQMV